MADERDEHATPSDRRSDGRFVKGKAPGPGRPRGSRTKIPVEWREGLREHFLDPKIFALLLKRIDKDLVSAGHAPTLALKMAAHAFGEPPAEINLDARGDLRTALLAAFAGRKPDPPSDPEAS